MNIKLEAKLCKKYPRLYADRFAPMQNTAMCWGFQCGDGWYKIIDQLSSELEKIIVQYIKDNPYSADCYLRASTVKEKYGTLRFYMVSETAEMSALIRKAEKQSAKTCEVCGEPGKLRGRAWYSTRCTPCWEKERKCV